MRYILIPIMSLIVGVGAGSLLTVAVPLIYAKYMSVGIFAALDSLLGGIKGIIDDKFDGVLLITGFFVNAFAAAGIAYLGDLIGLELYIAAIVAFGIRIFNNLSYIRIFIVDTIRIKLRKRKAEKLQKNL